MDKLILELEALKKKIDELIKIYKPRKALSRSEISFEGDDGHHFFQGIISQNGIPIVPERPRRRLSHSRFLRVFLDRK